MDVAQTDSNPYLTARLTDGPVVQFAFAGFLRSTDTLDLLLVRKSSIILLCRETGTGWIKKLEKPFYGTVRDAKLVKNKGQCDMLALSVADEGMYFIGFHYGTLKVIYELLGTSSDKDLVNCPGHEIVFDDGCRALCSLARQGELTLHTLKYSSNTGDIDIMARRKVAISGNLQRCCFLSHHDAIVSIVLHVSYLGVSRLVLLYWREHELLNRIEPRNMPLDASLGLCMYMVPLSKRRGYFLHITPEWVSLISEHHVQSGDLQFEQCRIYQNDTLPSAVVESTLDSNVLAVLAFDDGQICLISLSDEGRLVTDAWQSLDFPATSIAVLENRRGTENLMDTDHSITIFATGDTGESGVFEIGSHHHSPEQAHLNESAPFNDLLVLSSVSKRGKPLVLTVGGTLQYGELLTHSAGLSSSLVHDILISDLHGAVSKRIFSVKDTLHTTYLLLSLPWSSVLLRCEHGHVPQLHNVSDDFGIATDQSTILFCAFTTFFLQVTPTNIFICENSTVHALHHDDSSVVNLLADCCDGKLALLKSAKSVCSLRTMDVVKHGDVVSLIPTGSNLVFRSEPNCMKFASAQTSEAPKLILLCFADGSIVLVQHSSAENVILFRDDSSLRDLQVDAYDAASSQPHSCTILFKNGVTHLIISTRSGFIVHFRGIDSRFERVQTSKVSSTSVVFIARQDTTAETYFLGDSLGQLSIMNNVIRIVTIGTQVSPQEAAVYTTDPFFDHGSQETATLGLLSLGAESLTFFNINEEIEPIIERVQLGETPRRLLYLEHQDCFIVATNKLIVPVGGEKDACKHIANLKIIKDNRCISESPIRDSKKQTMLFKPGDTIYAMIHWDVTINGKARSWTVIGSSRRNVKAGRTSGGGGGRQLEGRLTVLRLKVSKNEADIRKEFSPSFPNPIYALAAIGTMSLVVAHGTMLEISSLDIENRGLASRCLIKLRSAAIALHVSRRAPRRGDDDDVDGKVYIFAATQKDSIIVLCYNETEDRLIRVAADPYPQLSLSLLSVTPHILALSDKSKNVLIFAWNADSKRLKVVDTISMPTIIVKMAVLSIPPPSTTTTNNHRKEDEQEDGLGSDPFVILAAGLDGSLHVIFRIHQKLHRRIMQSKVETSNQFWDQPTFSKSVDSLDDAEVRSLFDPSQNDAVDVDTLRYRLGVAIEARTNNLLA